MWEDWQQQESKLQEDLGGEENEDQWSESKNGDDPGFKLGDSTRLRWIPRFWHQREVQSASDGFWEAGCFVASIDFGACGWRVLSTR